MGNKKVLVSGVFDLFHSGHIAFFEEASKYGQLYVAMGSDQTIIDLKGKPPINNEQERLYLVQSNKFVHKAFISSGSGILDFIKELKELKPDIFLVNEDGNYKEKEELCKELNIEYIVLKREPNKNLPKRSTTQLRNKTNIPFRIDLAGGWLDQLVCNSLYPGPVLTISIEPTIEFNHRSGMASSTRKTAIELWQNDIPVGDYEKNARTLFCCDNPPGTKEISGSQDSIGIVMPGLNKLNYDNNYWPKSIESIYDEDILRFIEDSLYLIPLHPRLYFYDVFKNSNIWKYGVKNLSDSAIMCWEAIKAKDIKTFGEFITESFHYQLDMFPSMAEKDIYNTIKIFSKKTLGYKLSGAGGGGYLILVSEVDIPHSIRIKIRRKNNNF